MIEQARKHLRMALETGTVELQGKMLPLSDPSVKQLLSLCMAIVKNGLELGEPDGEAKASMPAEMLASGPLELKPLELDETWLSTP